MHAAAAKADFAFAMDQLPQAPQALPYEGAKPMLRVENREDRQLLEGMYPRLPEPKKKKPKT